MNKQIKNAVPVKYRTYFITPGIADYTAENIGKVLVQKSALDKMLQSFVGKPVVNETHTDKDPEELFQALDSGAPPEEWADGIISSVGYDTESGWYWADFLVWNADAIQNIEDGYSVSCAYDILKSTDEGGTFNNVEYNLEVLEGEYVHLALVTNPRYERAFIIKNSKTHKEETVKLVFKKKKTVKNEAPEEEVKKDETEELENADGYVETEDGEQIPVAELIKMYKEKKEAELENAGQVYNMDDMVEVDGEEMTVAELMAACGYGEEMKNAEPPTDEEAEEMVDESKQISNSKKDEKGKANFKKVKNAASSGGYSKPRINTIASRLEKGSARYGSNKGGK